MAVVSTTQAEVGAFRANWILDKKNDLIWYIGSALAGYLYAALVWYFGRSLTNPVEDILGTLHLGGIQIDITLRLLVILSWMYIVDAPHVFATLARTFFDPDERAVRKTELRRSWLWFAFGPAVIIAPYIIGALLAPLGMTLSDFWLNIGGLIFFVFFRLWAYYHVVRQHWGFFSLYKRRNNDFADERNNKIDIWFFNLILYLPLVLFMTSTYYDQTPGFPSLGLRAPLLAGISIGEIIYPLALVLYILTLGGYIGWNIYQLRNGHTLNAPKLLFMALLIPLHIIAFSRPLFALFLVPIVTVGHNIQYHRIIWSYGKNKYAQEQRPGFAIARQIFRHIWIYALTGILFTFALYRGPWVEFINNLTGTTLNTALLNSLSMMAGVADPTKLQLGEKIFAAMIIGWAMQHYYLDSKIWRVRSDKMVQKNLKLQETQP